MGLLNVVNGLAIPLLLCSSGRSRNMDSNYRHRNIVMTVTVPLECPSFMNPEVLGIKTVLGSHPTNFT